jgi:hypothetical protein
VSKKASLSASSRPRVQGSILPEGDSGLVGTDEGAWTGALGRTGECDEVRRDVGCDKEVEDWFMAAREESAGRSALLFAGCRAIGSFYEEMVRIKDVKTHVAGATRQMLIVCTIGLGQRRECASRSRVLSALVWWGDD